MGICVFTAIALLQVLFLVHAYETTTPRRDWTTPDHPDDNHEGHDAQWSGVGEGGGFGQQPNWGQQSETGNRYNSQAQKSDSLSAFAKPEGHMERHGFPKHCVSEQDPMEVCNYYVEIIKDAGSNFLRFQLSTRLQKPEDGGYVAMGLSTDKQMGDDDIVECVKEGSGSVRAYHSWATGKLQPTRLIENRNVIDMVSSDFDDVKKRLTCRFTRPLIADFKVNETPVKIDFIHGKYFVFLAVGGMRSSNSDVIGFHGVQPEKSGTAYVSQNFLGYGQTAGKHGHNGNDGEHGYRSPVKNNAQQNKINAVSAAVTLFCFLRFY